MHVIYGSSSGLTAVANQQWTEYDLGTRAVTNDQPEDNPGFGSTLVAANFGRGTADDLAVGVPEQADGASQGAVQILYGGRGGLSGSGSKQLKEDKLGFKGSDPWQEEFGSALSVLPQPGSEHATLVVGSPRHAIRPGEFDGMVHLIPGSETGLATRRAQALTAGQFPQQPPGSNFGAAVS